MKFEWEAGSNREVFEERPLYFDDFQISMRFNSLPWAVIANHDIIYFGLATGDKNALHFNEAFAKQTALGGRVAHGELVMNSLFGALHHVNFWERSLEALCEKYAKFLLPVFPGDRVKHFLSVAETRESKSRPDKGIVKFEFYTLNQHYEKVAEGWFSALMRKKEALK